MTERKKGVFEFVVAPVIFLVNTTAIFETMKEYTKKIAFKNSELWVSSKDQTIKMKKFYDLKLNLKFKNVEIDHIDCIDKTLKKYKIHKKEHIFKYHKTINTYAKINIYKMKLHENETFCIFDGYLTKNIDLIRKYQRRRFLKLPLICLPFTSLLLYLCYT